MRPSLSFKTLLRTPLKTIMTFLLTALASFALFSRITDFNVTTREMKKIEDSYNGVIAIDNGVPLFAENRQHYSNLPKTEGFVSMYGTKLYLPDKPITISKEQINAFSKITSVEKRYMTGGVIDSLDRLTPRVSEDFDWGYDYGARFIVEGTFEGFTENSVFFLGENNFVLNFSDIKQLAGKREYENSETIPLLAGEMMDRSDTEDYGAYYIPATVYYGNDNTIITNYTTSITNSRFLIEDDPYRREFIETLVPGTRYLFIGRYVLNDYDSSTYEEKIKEQMAKSLSQMPDELIEAIKNGEITIEPIEEMLAHYEENKAKYDDIFGEGYFWGFYELIAGKQMMRLGDNDTIEFVPSFVELSDTENMAKVQELIDITNRDIHTFDIVYTENMASIPRFNERSMVITSGRAITTDDTDSCVISEYLANEYGLNLGDKLSVGLGDRLFEQYAQMGAVSYIPERNWNVVKETELEIVGFYKDIDTMESRNADMFMGYSPNTIFVPLIQLPIEIPADHEIKPGEFSIFVENAAEYEAVLAQAEILATEIGVQLRASDGGYSDMKDSINENAKTSMITMCLYVFTAALALFLSVYLYIGRNTKSYAIMRALGTTAKRSRKALTLPFGLLAIIGIALGGAIGLVYTSQEMQSVLKSFEVVGSSYTADASIPALAVIIALICEAFLIVVITALFLHRLAKTPPLALLHGGSATKAKPQNKEKPVKKSSYSTYTDTFKNTSHTGTFTTSPLPQKRKYNAPRQVLGYITKHMMRTKWKTIIALIIPLFLSVAIGVITLTKTNYEKMFEQIDVKTSINNINHTSVLSLADSELVESLYFYCNKPVMIRDLKFYDEATETEISVDVEADIKITNDINRYFNDTYKSDPPIFYTNRYSDEIFVSDMLSDTENAVCIIGNNIAESNEIALGDSINLIQKYDYEDMIKMENNPDYTNILMGQYEGQYETDEELQILINEGIERDIAGLTKSFTVVGIADGDNDDVLNTIYLPYGKKVESLLSGLDADMWLNASAVDFTEITLSDNERINDINTLLDGYVADSIASLTSVSAGSSSYYTDTSELDNIRRVRDLLTTLFPIAVVAAVLIGAAVPILIIIQSSKEAATMRVLGTTKKRTVSILSLEEVILCIIGLAIAAVVLYIYNAGLFMQSGITLGICAGLYLAASIVAAIIAAMATTNKKALELLQVKE
jgi:ABC-type lipoprotein release transport system permease subunit